MPLCVLGFLAGDLWFQQLSQLPGLYTVSLALLTACVCGRFRKWWCLAFVAGWLWAGAYAYLQLRQANLPPEFEGKELLIQGVIAGLPQPDERRVRFDFVLTDNPEALPARLKLSWYYPKVTLRAGQHWSFKVKLKAVHGLLNPGGFDYERWLFTQGIGATGYIRDPEHAGLIGQDYFWQNPDVIRQMIAERLSSLPNLKYIGFLEALTIGKTDQVSQQQWRILRKTGTIHLMAISGSHISLIAGLTYLLVLQLQLSFSVFGISPQRIAAVASGLTGLGYALLAGFSIPVQRALLMLIVALVGIVWQRHIRLARLLSIAVLLIVLRDPLAVLAVGFWLSFLAILLIFYSLTGRIAGSRYWNSVLKVHGITALGLAPLLVVFFQQISLIAPLANLIAVPVVSFLIVPPALVAVLSLFIQPDFAAWLFAGLDFVLDKFYGFLSLLSEWRYSALTGIAASVPAMCLAGMGLLILFMPRGLPGRSLGCLLCLPLFYSSPPKLTPGTVRMTLLDVGQGLSAVIQTAGHVLIYDTGIKFSEQADSGQSVLLPFLASQGLSHINTLVVSHGDNDHIGGAASLLAEFTPDSLLTSVPGQLADYSPQRCLQGRHWIWDGVEFSILAPAVEGLSGENNNSCVLKIANRQGAILLPGDIENNAEDWLVKTYAEQLKASVLVAPHHGSKTSSTQAFLEQVKPKLILIPAGYQNQFKFPQRDVLERYQANHTPWLNVSEQGALTVNITNEQLLVSSFRVEHAKYWNKSYSSATFKEIFN